MALTWNHHWVEANTWDLGRALPPFQREHQVDFLQRCTVCSVYRVRTRLALSPLQLALAALPGRKPAEQGWYWVHGEIGADNWSAIDPPCMEVAV